MSIETSPHQTTEEIYDCLPFNLQEALFEIPKLEETGSNYTNWNECLHNIVNASTGTPDYLNMTLDPIDTGDIMISNMIKLTVSPNIRSQLHNTFSAKETYEKIKSILNLPNPSDLELWREILNTRYDPNETLSVYIDRMKSKFDELNQTGFEWSRESMTSVFLHMDFPNNITTS